MRKSVLTVDACGIIREREETKDCVTHNSSRKNRNRAGSRTIRYRAQPRGSGIEDPPLRNSRHGKAFFFGSVQQVSFCRDEEEKIVGRSSRIAGNQRTAEDKPSLTESEGILFSGAIRHELLLAINKNISTSTQRAIRVKDAAQQRNCGIATRVVKKVGPVQLA